MFTFCALVTHTPPGRKRRPNPVYFLMWNAETPYRSPSGESRPQGLAYGGAGLGCRKKRMPGCNGSDTGLNVTRHESEPTSDGSYIARESVKTFL